MQSRGIKTARDIGLALAFILVVSGMAINWIADHKVSAWAVGSLAFVFLLLLVRLCGVRRDSAR